MRLYNNLKMKKSSTKSNRFGKNKTLTSLSTRRETMTGDGF
jgi:hypothetical protein